MARPFKFTDKELEIIVRTAIARINGDPAYDFESDQGPMPNVERLFPEKITPPRLTLEAKKIDARFEESDARKPLVKALIGENNKKYDDYKKKVLGNSEVIKRLSGPHFFQIYLRINNGDIGKATQEVSEDLRVLIDDYELQAQRIKHLERRNRELELLASKEKIDGEKTYHLASENEELRSMITALKNQIREMEVEMDEYVMARGMEIQKQCGIPIKSDKVVRLKERKW